MSASSATALHRTTGLARVNAILLVRNRLTLLYAVVLPLLPLALVLGADRGDVGAGAAAVISCVVLAVLFPVYYNLLSMFVTRRDELVLKRLRTGETRDLELLASLALPGTVVALVVCAVAVPVAMALGVRAPENLALYAVTVLVAAAVYAAFAIWTAAWTRNAEAAQMTSMPVLALTVLGQLAVGFPESVQRWTDLTPGAAMTDLVRVGWFGLEEGSTTPSLGFAETWASAGQPLLVLLGWGLIGVVLAARSLQWEPRT